MVDIPHSLAWRFDTSFSSQNQGRLQKYVNLHPGQRCFILGNGPSLGGMDLSVLQDEITFGLNRIYLLSEKYPFLPTYFVCINELVLEQFAEEIQSIPSPKFLNWNRRKNFDFKDNSISFVKVSNRINDFFNRKFSAAFSSGGTVTYMALQIAFIMGFSEVVLIGVDHSFKDKGTPNKVETRASVSDPNHFHPNYFPMGVKWQLPDLIRSELAYTLARQVFENNGRKIIDATVNGQCPVFEKADFHAIFP